METTKDLLHNVREKFPEISELADSLHIKMWGTFNESDDSYIWFESLANAINIHMSRGIDPVQHETLFSYIAGAHANGSREVKECIDVSFTENLFWQVKPMAVEPYWTALPESLKELYLGFHHKAPL
jgi:hypothetical protein